MIRKWQHSLVELDLSWTSNTEALDQALMALVEERNSMLRFLNLCGSSITFRPIREILRRCCTLESINLTSCRAMPRGVKRLHDPADLITLRQQIADGKFDEPEDAEHE